MVFLCNSQKSFQLKIDAPKFRLDATPIRNQSNNEQCFKSMEINQCTHFGNAIGQILQRWVGFRLPCNILVSFWPKPASVN